MKVKKEKKNLGWLVEMSSKKFGKDDLSKILPTQVLSVIQVLPSEEFEITAYSQGANIKTHGKQIFTTLSDLTVNSQDYSHCMLAVSFP